MSFEDEERVYTSRLQRTTDALAFAIAYSSISGIVPKTESQAWSIIFFTRMTACAVSLMSLCPRSKLNPYPMQWDLTSIASIARTIYEVYLTLEYFCFESIQVDESACRLQIMHYHDQVTRQKKYQKLHHGESNGFFESEIERQKQLLNQNEFFLSLLPGKRKDIIAGKSPFYLSQVEIVNRAKGDGEAMYGWYIELSAHVHCLPMSFVRSAFHQSGNGWENQFDKLGIATALEISATCIEVATRQYIELHKEQIDFSSVKPFPVEQMLANARRGLS